MTRVVPDVCIVGAPKCGTTALFDYLRDHPGVCASDVKEPGWFCHDAPKYRQIKTLEAYEAMFNHARPGQITLEASAMYMFSDVAMPALIAHNPAVKIIAMARNPLELAISLFEQKRYSREEHIEDFCEAWLLSTSRAEGKMVKAHCRAPQYLNYAGIVQLGAQILRLKRLVPTDHLHVIVHDDFSDNPAVEYRSVLEFLELPHDGRMKFDRVNERKQHRWPWLAGAVQCRCFRTIKVAALARYPKEIVWAVETYQKLTSKPADRRQISPGIRADIIAKCREDVALLERLLDRDLSHWLEQPH